jgi:hypothetical protein
MKTDYYFCNATIRVKECKLSANVCCLICRHQEECSLTCGKVKPCKEEDFGEDEGCEFLI